MKQIKFDTVPTRFDTEDRSSAGNWKNMKNNRLESGGRDAAGWAHLGPNGRPKMGPAVQPSVLPSGSSGKLEPERRRTVGGETGRAIAIGGTWGILVIKNAWATDRQQKICERWRQDAPAEVSVASDAPEAVSLTDGDERLRRQRRSRRLSSCAAPAPRRRRSRRASLRRRAQLSGTSGGTARGRCAVFVVLDRRRRALFFVVLDLGLVLFVALDRQRQDAG